MKKALTVLFLATVLIGGMLIGHMLTMSNIRVITDDGENAIVDVHGWQYYYALFDYTEFYGEE